MKKYKLRVPDSWKDIKLSQYQRFIKEVGDNDSKDFIELKMVSCLCGITDEIVKGMYAADLKPIIQQLTKVLNEQPDLVMRFNYNGVQYGFEPEISKIKFGAKIDADEYMKDVQTWDKLMAVLYRRVKQEKNGSYLIEEYTATEPPMDLPMNIVQGAMLFFYNITKELLVFTPKSLEKILKQYQKKFSTEINGDGIHQYIESVREIFSDLRELQDFPTKKYSNS